MKTKKILGSSPSMTNIFQADKKRCGTMAKRIPKEDIRPSEKTFSDGLFNHAIILLAF